MTIDLDLVLDLDAANVDRAVAVLVGLGLVPRLPVAAEAFADPDQREVWVRERNLQVFSMHDPTDPRREVDLFAVEPVPFDELQVRASTKVIDGVEVAVAAIEDLITMKREAGRPQDLADIEALLRLADEPGPSDE